MVRSFQPIQFGGGIQNYRWYVSNTDLNTAAGNGAQTLNLVGNPASPPSTPNATAYQYSQGSLILFFRVKTITAFVGTSMTHLYLDIGFPQTILNSAGVLVGSQVAAAAPHAINGGSGAGTGGVVTDLITAVADNVFSAAIAANLAPGDAPFGITITLTPTGLTAWTALSAGQFELDLFSLTPSSGQIYNSTYYNNPSPGNP